MRYSFAFIRIVHTSWADSRFKTNSLEACLRVVNDFALVELQCYRPNMVDLCRSAGSVYGCQISHRRMARSLAQQAAGFTSQLLRPIIIPLGLINRQHYITTDIGDVTVAIALSSTDIKIWVLFTFVSDH